MAPGPLLSNLVNGEGAGQDPCQGTMSLVPKPRCERAALRLQGAERAYKAARVPSASQSCSLVEALLVAGRYEPALDVARKAGKHDANVARLRAETEWRLGMFAEARTTLALHSCDARCNELLQFVTSVEAHNVAAEEILARDGSSSSALEPLSTIIRLPEACSSPLQAACLEKRARVLLANRDPAAALADASAAIEMLVPADATARLLILRADAYMALREHERAFNDLRRAAALSPSTTAGISKLLREAAAAAIREPRRHAANSALSPSHATTWQPNRMVAMPAGATSRGLRGSDAPAPARPSDGGAPDRTGAPAPASGGGVGSSGSSASGSSPPPPQHPLPRYYSILGVELDATEADVSRGYRRMAAKWHPDKWVMSGESKMEVAAHRFRIVNEAYETLKDSVKRAEYDAKNNV